MRGSWSWQVGVSPAPLQQRERTLTPRLTRPQRTPSSPTSICSCSTSSCSSPRSRGARRWAPAVAWSHVDSLASRRSHLSVCLQRSTGPDQNPLRLQQNPELDQLLKDGCTFTVVDQPVSLDRLQIRNIDQLNASSPNSGTFSVSDISTSSIIRCLFLLFQRPGFLILSSSCTRTATSSVSERSSCRRRPSRRRWFSVSRL